MKVGNKFFNKPVILRLQKIQAGCILYAASLSYPIIPSEIPDLFNIPVKFTFYFDQPNTKTVIALAVFVQLQEAMEAKVVYLYPDVTTK